MSSEIYEKQLKWKSIALQKAIENREVDEKKLEGELTFTPQIFSNHQKKFSGSAGLLTKTAGEHHVQRQAKARKEKVTQSYTSQQREPSRNLDSRVLRETRRAIPLPSETSFLQAFDDNTAGSIPYGQNSEVDVNRFISTNGTDANYEEEVEEGEDEDDFEGLAVEVLERERREWRVERMRLIQCIHHQQIELAQRAAAAHERATEIAKEFSRSIEIYEERLVLVENNVQQEIKGMKSVTDSLKTAISSLNTDKHSVTVDLRLSGLERSMQDVLSRLDDIAMKIK